MKWYQYLIAVVVVLAIAAGITVPYYFGGVKIERQTDRTDDLETQIEGLVEAVNELLDQGTLTPGAEPGTVEAGVYTVNTSITINLIINVIPGINAAIEAFQDAACTIPQETDYLIGDVGQGALAYEAYNFFVKNTGDVELLVHLSTGSTPWGNAVLIAAPELTDYSFTLPVGAVQEVELIVSVNFDADLGNANVPCYIVAETTGG